MAPAAVAAALRVWTTIGGRAEAGAGEEGRRRRRRDAARALGGSKPRTYWPAAGSWGAPGRSSRVGGSARSLERSTTEDRDRASGSTRAA